MIIKGDIIVDNTFSTGSNNSIELQGSSFQTIKGSVGWSCDSLIINNSSSSGVKLEVPVTINKTLKLTQGQITTDATNIITVSKDATVTGGSSSAFINGPIKKES